MRAFAAAAEGNANLELGLLELAVGNQALARRYLTAASRTWEGADASHDGAGQVAQAMATLERGPS
jgi:hypothetical protein